MDLSQSPNMGMQSNQQIQNQLPSTGLLQQQQQQSQTKFVFNVETDKTSPSLQLLFQLPSVQQVQQQSTAQNQQQKQLQLPCSNQAQTQTNLQVTPNSQPQQILSTSVEVTEVSNSLDGAQILLA